MVINNEVDQETIVLNLLNLARGSSDDDLTEFAKLLAPFIIKEIEKVGRGNEMTKLFRKSEMRRGL